MTELWRVADLVPNAPAHRLASRDDQPTSTMCRWTPTKPGKVITRAELLSHFRFVCVFCAQSVAGRP